MSDEELNLLTRQEALATVAEEARRARESEAMLLAGLKGVFALVEEGSLVRDIRKDCDPATWMLKAMRLVKNLADAQRAIDKAEGRE